MCLQLQPWLHLSRAPVGPGIAQPPRYNPGHTGLNEGITLMLMHLVVLLRLRMLRLLRVLRGLQLSLAVLLLQRCCGSKSFWFYI